MSYQSRMRHKLTLLLPFRGCNTTASSHNKIIVPRQILETLRFPPPGSNGVSHEEAEEDPAREQERAVDLRFVIIVIATLLRLRLQLRWQRGRGRRSTIIERRLLQQLIVLPRTAKRSIMPHGRALKARWFDAERVSHYVFAGDDVVVDGEFDAEGVGVGGEAVGTEGAR